MAATENKTSFYASETRNVWLADDPQPSPNLHFFFSQQNYLLYRSLQTSVTLASWINRPPLLEVSPSFTETRRRNCRVSASPGRPDYYLKGGESAGLVRQKKPEGESELARLQGWKELRTSHEKYSGL